LVAKKDQKGATVRWVGPLKCQSYQKAHTREVSVGIRWANTSLPRNDGVEKSSRVQSPNEN